MVKKFKIELWVRISIGTVFSGIFWYSESSRWYFFACRGGISATIMKVALIIFQKKVVSSVFTSAWINFCFCLEYCVYISSPESPSVYISDWHDLEVMGIIKFRTIFQFEELYLKLFKNMSIKQIKYFIKNRVQFLSKLD